MQEMYQGIEKFKKDEQAKKNDMNMQIQRVIQDINKLKDYQAPVAAIPGAGNTQNAKFSSSIGNMDIITEVKASMTKLLENKIIDLEFNLNNKIVTSLLNY